MRIGDIAIVSLVLFFILFPKNSWRVESYQKWTGQEMLERQALDLEEDVARAPMDAAAALPLADLYTTEVDHPDWALAVLGPLRTDTRDWRVQVALASAHAQRFEWTEALAAAKSAVDACAPPSCSDDMSVRLGLYEQGLEAAEKTGAKQMTPDLTKAALHSRPQVWFPQAQ